MAVKKITVTKDGVTKKIDADLEKDYVKNGWIVEKTNQSQVSVAPTIISKQKSKVKSENK